MPRAKKYRSPFKSFKPFNRCASFKPFKTKATDYAPT
jgi:hypothetical protein